jgi:hypothetical protein
VPLALREKTHLHIGREQEAAEVGVEGSWRPVVAHERDGELVALFIEAVVAQARAERGAVVVRALHANLFGVVFDVCGVAAQLLGQLGRVYSEDFRTAGGHRHFDQVHRGFHRALFPPGVIPCACRIDGTGRQILTEICLGPKGIS